MPLAGPGARAFAFLMDWLIRSALSLAWYASAALIYNRGEELSAPLSPDAAWFIAVLTPTAAIYLLYHPLLEILTRGSTPGKHLAGVQIISNTGASASVAALLIRNVFRIIDCLPVAYACGLLTTLCTRQHVRIGDMAAGTLLVYLHAPEALIPDAAGALASVATATVTSGAIAAPAHTAAGAGAPQTALSASLLQRAPLWSAALARLRRLSGGRVADVDDVVAIADDYRLLAHDVARARRLLPASDTRLFLESAYSREHALLHRAAWHPGYALLTLFRDDLPAVVHWLGPYILWCTTLFLLAIAAGYWMVHTYPDLIALFASPELIASVERGQLWTEGLLNIVPSAVLSLQILTNNVVVSLFAYCAGFIFGLGTVYIVGLNGLMLGAVFAFTGQHGLGYALFRFVVAHGCVEISVMCLSGAAGAAVGAALFRPERGTRLASFQHAALQSGKLIAACVLLLIGSGIIEGYLSPAPAVTLSVRLGVGVGYWLFMVALLQGWLLPRHARASDAS